MGESKGPPIALWLVGAGFAIAGFCLSLIGGSLFGFLLSIIATVLVVACLFINQRREMIPGYDYGKPWFRKGVAAVYWVSAVGSAVHIVRYAIAVASN